MEMNTWKVANYKIRIQITKMYVLSKLLFLATIFPPDNKCLVKSNKMCVCFIWGNNIEVTKRALLFKPERTRGTWSN